MPKLRQLRHFVTIAEEGQITRAAQKLNLAQPALSSGVAQLESQLGVALFHRHAHGVSLTSAGEAYLGKVLVALTALEDAELTVRALGRAARDTVEWGFIGSPPMVQAPEVFRAVVPRGNESSRKEIFRSGCVAPTARNTSGA